MGLDFFLIRSRLNNDFKTPRLKRFDGRTRWAVVIDRWELDKLCEVHGCIDLHLYLHGRGPN